ncbi:protein FAR1-RELATED SEQUENCE 5-like [Rhizophagus irregularis DAOM 181602=DAOM 197198]|nr:protein FAR1-RELATED SEQUENCE 5-like [Rhizophagus irregularis DAOM 181602=DAOM 197198]
MNSEIVLNNTNQDDTYEIKLQVGDLFDDWNSVHIAVEAYAKQQGFVANKYRKDLDSIDKSIIRCQEYVYWKFGINQTKKVEDINTHRDTVSGKTNCPWHVNFYFEKRASAIKLTQLSDYHNHQCNSKIIDLAPKNLKLPHAILSKIEHYTVSGHLGAGQQYDLLTKEFPEHHIKKKNLYNAISKFRGVRIHNEFDAAEMLSYLLKQRDIDQDYIVIPRLEGPNNELTGLFWMTSQQHNDLWPKYHDVIIHDNTAKTNRYDMALSLFVCIDNNFKMRIVGQALIKYETQAAYEWIFQCMLESVDNVSPKVIFTDGDPAVIAAIRVIYPQTQHLLCIYHIVENVKKKAKSKLHGDSVKKFVEDFYHMRNSYSQEEFELRYQNMLIRYELCHFYFENKLYPNRTAWARYSITKIFTAGVESTQRVEPINGVLKKHVDRGTLLKELVIAIECKLEKEASYTRIKDYYESNPSVGLPSTYNSVFKEIDNVLKTKESNNASDGIIEQLYDVPQIRLKELLSGILSDNIQELWKVSSIVPASDKPFRPHYVIILKDSSSLCICMYIINQEMLCRHQYRILIQLEKAVFHLSLIHGRWFESIPSEVSNITIVKGKTSNTATLLHYINQIRLNNVYIPAAKERVNKKVQYGNTMSLVKTSIQIAVAESATAELIGILMQFIMKYRNNTGLGIEEVHQFSSLQNNVLQESLINTEICNNTQQPLDNLQISNPEYHKAKGHPPKRYKSLVEDNNQTSMAKSNESGLKTCSYCLGRAVEDIIFVGVLNIKPIKKMLISIIILMVRSIVAKLEF